MNRLVYVVLALMFAVSSAVAKSSDVVKMIEFIKIEKFELKGVEQIDLTAEVKNNSKFDVAMEGGRIELILSGKVVAKLIQNGRIHSAAGEHQSISTSWRIEDVDPFTMLMLTAKISQNDFTGLSANYEATLSAGKNSVTISGKEVEIKELIAIFA